jgi:hypothetical protein
VAPGCGYEPIGPGFSSGARALESRDRATKAVASRTNGLSLAVITDAPDVFWISWAWGEFFATPRFDPRIREGSSERS